MRAPPRRAILAGPTPHPASGPDRGTLFGGLFGLFLGLGLLKFGNPILLDRLVETPKTFEEWRVFAWPVGIGFAGLVGILTTGIATLGLEFKSRVPASALGCLGAWIAWQAMASLTSVEPTLSRPVFAHFLACTTCFILGAFFLNRVARPRTFWLCLVGGLIGVLGMAFDQHFGGLEATRRMILQSATPSSLSPEYLARIQSDRVFSTLVYPNALAGVILLLLPVATFLSWQAGLQHGGGRGRWVFSGTMLAGGLAVLLWSGSKAGWLIAMLATLTLLFLSPVPRRLQLVMALAFLAAGLAGFGIVYREKLSRGATSVSARWDYWTAAVEGFRERPLLGHGPGVFKRVYARVKRPESEMAQLAHNDYLQQATDSGLPGCLAYAGFVVGSLTHAFRRLVRWSDPLTLSVWLGLGAWFAQGIVEFGLYIPAPSWCAFGLLGWLLAQAPPECRDAGDRHE